MSKHSLARQLHRPVVAHPVVTFTCRTKLCWDSQLPEARRRLLRRRSTVVAVLPRWRTAVHAAPTTSASAPAPTALLLLLLRSTVPAPAASTAALRRPAVSTLLLWRATAVHPTASTSLLRAAITPAATALLLLGRWCTVTPTLRRAAVPTRRRRTPPVHPATPTPRARRRRGRVAAVRVRRRRVAVRVRRRCVAVRVRRRRRRGAPVHPAATVAASAATPSISTAASAAAGPWSRAAVGTSSAAARSDPALGRCHVRAKHGLTCLNGMDDVQGDLPLAVEIIGPFHSVNGHFLPCLVVVRVLHDLGVGWDSWRPLRGLGGAPATGVGGAA